MTVKIQKAEPKSKITFVQQVIKGDTYLVMAAAEFEPEDEFAGLYYSSANTSRVFLEPPFNPKILKHMHTKNNILGQCVEAMEVNIDGTGHELVPIEEGVVPDKAEVKRINGFFSEPYPGTSMMEIRRSLRRDLEDLGYGFLEVLRNMKGEMVAIRNISAQTVRFVRLDAPVQVTKKVMRGGEEVELTYMDRERRFAQRVGPEKYRYYREYGTTRHVDRDTGDWESKENPVDPQIRGTELLVFIVHQDVESPYGVPRWINQLPSVVGSRKAEEQNLEFFDAGGLPPSIVFIQGGTLAKETADQLRMYLSGQMKAKQRAAVVEAQSSSGSLDSAGQVKITVERFGGEQGGDSMYEKYDKNSEEHVRVGFRLPPLFVGKAADYSYASASTSYMVAEAQVFDPERCKFDSTMDRTVMKELKAKTVRYKSKPITLKDVASQLAGLKVAQPISKGENFIDQMNKVTGLTLVYEKPEPPPAPIVAPTGKPNAQVPAKPGKAVGPAPKSAKKVLKLARDFLAAESLVDAAEVTDTERELIRKSVDDLDGEDRELFRQFVSSQMEDFGLKVRWG